MIRRLRRWWYFQHYGVCPDHFVLCERGGGYEPKWICRKCDEENRHKHEMRSSSYHFGRQEALERLMRAERIRGKE